VSASMGVTLYPQDGVEADVLLRHADQAMYLAKQAGKNRYHRFDVAQDAAVNTQRASLERIRRALDEHEFVLYYQPKVNMKTGTVIGAEALIRWQHPERGLLAPADFLPVIETDPISVELGEWVIDTALAQMTEWHAQGLVLGVSVNIGARQLQQGDFAARLSGLLAAHPAVEPRYLELEVLETSALEDMAQVSAVMYACSGMGVQFALDDFGTGYSSLTYLKRLPAEMLKIDQSFVCGMLDDPDDLAIVKGVIGLVTAFRRQVIAEGVETVAHGELLLSLGCELAQGYGIARPMPAQAFPGWVGTWRPDASWEVWRGRSPTRDDQVLVFAEVEHRHWLRAIEFFLAGDQEAPPRLEAFNCHFGRWQATEGRARFGQGAEFAAIAALHDRVHALGRELIELHARGHQEEAQRQLEELRSLRDQLIAMLRQLIQPLG
jgi:EAL domain-containing protein (putative c-di-GMP-specific phosphodiesterase class I)